MRNPGTILLLAALMAACAALPPAPVSGAGAETQTAPALIEIDQLRPETEHEGRSRNAADIDMIVLHTIGGATCKAGQVVFTSASGSAIFWRDWFVRQTDKSIHYVIGRDGQIAQQRPDLKTAGHVSYHGILPRVNDRSIGIELVNRGDGNDPFPEAQLAALNNLLGALARAYDLGPDDLRTHEELDPRMQPDCGGKPLRRNIDPGPLFPIGTARAAMQAER